MPRKEGDGDKAVRIKLWARAIASTFRNRGAFVTACYVSSCHLFFLSRFTNVDKGHTPKPKKMRK
jgi:hypothetical protein